MSAQDHFMLLSLDPHSGPSLRAQLEGQLRSGIRSGRLHPRTRLPSTRSLAAQLGVSRGVVVEAYGQLVAEGYLTSRQGAGTRVAVAGAPAPPPAQAPDDPRAPRYDFHPGTPDLAAFPRAQWLAATRRALRTLPDARLGIPDPRGAPELRAALAAHLGRVRGVVTSPPQVVICGGFWQGLRLVLEALHRRGARRVAMEDPGFGLHRLLARRVGLEAVGMPVDEHGLVVERLDGLRADALLLTPAHQFPTGALLAPERRSAVLDWAAACGALVIEDDYDAEYRYDREPVGALQGLSPDHVVYGGTASKTLAPALRLGWLALPERLVDDVVAGKALADGGSGTLDQVTYADFLERGDLDRHLRRHRLTYRRRRAALVAAVARELPEARVGGIAAGLHAVVTLPSGCDEARVVQAAAARGIRLEGLAPHRFDAAQGPPGLLLGYAAMAEPALRRGVRELAEVVRETTGSRRGSGRGRRRTAGTSPGTSDPQAPARETRALEARTAG